MEPEQDLRNRLDLAGEALATLPLDKQRRGLLYLLELLDTRAHGSDEYAALLLQLGTDIRQRVATGEW